MPAMDYLIDFTATGSSVLSDVLSQKVLCHKTAHREVCLINYSFKVVKLRLTTIPEAQASVSTEGTCYN